MITLPTCRALLIVLVTFQLTSCRNEEANTEESNRMHSITSLIKPQSTCKYYRLEDSYPSQWKQTNKEFIHEYPITSGSFRMNSSDRKSLHSIIRSRNTYAMNLPPVDCMFLPGVAFRFENNDTNVDLLVCFKCSELRFYLGEEIAWQSYFKSKDLKKLVQKLFPKDRAIQTIKWIFKLRPPKWSHYWIVFSSWLGLCL